MRMKFKRIENGFKTEIRDKTGRVELILQLVNRELRQYSLSLGTVVIEGFQTHFCPWPAQKTLVAALNAVEKKLNKKGYKRVDVPESLDESVMSESMC